MNIKKVKNPTTNDEIELLAHPKTRHKFLLALWEKYPEKSHDELLYDAEIEARKTGNYNPLILMEKKLEDFKKKFSAD